jgi:hypothetical protein
MSGFASPYPGYDVLARRDSVSWDDTTRAVVHRRLHEVPERRFLSPEEWATLEAVCARLLPQPDRPEAPVPIAPWIDRMLAENRHDGYRFADMPPLREAWRLGLRGIEEESARRFARPFAALAEGEQEAVLRAVQAGEVAGGAWERLPARRFFAHTLLRAVAGIYYAHPAAWSEIGFGGPASPRGYVRLGFGQRDPWEAEERPRG